MLLIQNIKILYDITIDDGNDAEKLIVLDKIQNELLPTFVNLSLQYSEAISSILQFIMPDLSLQNKALKMIARALFTAG